MFTRKQLRLAAIIVSMAFVLVTGKSRTFGCKGSAKDVVLCRGNPKMSPRPYKDISIVARCYRLYAKAKITKIVATDGSADRSGDVSIIYGGPGDPLVTLNLTSPDGNLPRYIDYNITVYTSYQWAKEMDMQITCFVGGIESFC